MALLASQIKKLPYRVEYTNEYGRQWVGFTEDSPGMVSKQGYIRIYPAKSIGVNSLHFEKRDMEFLFLKTTFAMILNPKRSRIVDRVQDDDIYGTM